MAMGLPVVAASVSAEGISAGEDEGLFRADSPEEFVARLGFLLCDDDEMQSMRRRAVSYVRHHFGWTATAEIMMKEYSRLAGEGA
jgi:glycosyltransferase involved in cell wall biosynthesis